MKYSILTLFVFILGAGFTKKSQVSPNQVIINNNIIDPNKWYYIKNVKAGQVLEIVPPDLAYKKELQGGPFVLKWPLRAILDYQVPKYKDFQLWKFVKSAKYTNCYYLQNKATGYCLQTEQEKEASLVHQWFEMNESIRHAKEGNKRLNFFVIGLGDNQLLIYSLTTSLLLDFEKTSAPAIAFNSQAKGTTYLNGFNFITLKKIQPATIPVWQLISE